ncbi:MAG: hypothetical protein MUP85_20065, partial [Candidatus Lokiarchaeota archaeon]|nr:hypothetical protein [Candidatus Lokiarchaeota archaeon]
MIKIFITYSIKLQDEPNLKNIPQNVIGIDIGQSLTKISYLYKNQLHLLIHPTQDDYDYINKYLIDNNLTDMKLNLTGGKAYYYQKQLSHSYKSTIFNEFEANVSGIDILFNLKKSKSLPESLITTIGTGSSMILKKESYEHIGGSALGGGFFMALIKLLYKITSYDEAIDLAEQGDRYKVDLKVADIYSPEDQRINAIFREFTAA